MKDFQNYPMLKFFLILISFLSFLTLSAQQVTNMLVTQEGDNVVITYDILSTQPGQTFNIKVECSADDGKNFDIIPKSISGDLKSVTSGIGKRIIWDVLSEREALVGDHFIFQLVASVNNPIDSDSGNSGTFTDSRDGLVYKWVKIGTQVWMAENLAYKSSSGSWAYKNDERNIGKYGRLYNWDTGKNVCPPGWHLPSDEEWAILFDYLGGVSIAGSKMKSMTEGKRPNIATNSSSDFAALPSGMRGLLGTFSGIDRVSFWWSSSEADTNVAWYLSMNIYISSVNKFSYNKKGGFSVRCVKD